MVVTTTAYGGPNQPQTLTGIETGPISDSRRHLLRPNQPQTLTGIETGISNQPVTRLCGPNQPQTLTGIETMIAWGLRVEASAQSTSNPYRD